MKKLLLVLALVASTAMAQGPRRGGMGPGFGAAVTDSAGATLDTATFDALKAYLGLSDTQVASLKAALKARADANQPIREQIQAKQKLLDEEMAKDNPNPTTVGNLMVEIKKLRDSIRDKATGPFTDALAVLTPAQQTKLKELEAAQKLVPSIRQAEVLGLLARPEASAGLRSGMAAGRGRQAMRAMQVRRAFRNQI